MFSVTDAEDVTLTATWICVYFAACLLCSLCTEIDEAELSDGFMIASIAWIGAVITKELGEEMVAVNKQVQLSREDGAKMLRVTTVPLTSDGVR